MNISHKKSNPSDPNRVNISQSHTAVIVAFLSLRLVETPAITFPILDQIRDGIIGIVYLLVATVMHVTTLLWKVRHVVYYQPVFSFRRPEAHDAHVFGVHVFPHFNIICVEMVHKAFMLPATPPQSRQTTLFTRTCLSNYRVQPLGRILDLYPIQCWDSSCTRLSSDFAGL